MKKAIVLSIALIIVSYFCSCEKDDICADGTPTTPGVVISFYERDNQAQLKNVVNLKVIAEGMENGIEWPNGTDVFTGNTITVPLRTNADATKYRFINNSLAEDITNNEDVLTFNYTRNELYVSRACGYKTHFNLNADPAVAVVHEDGGDNFWINDITIVKTNIEDQNGAHIKIYF
jgi:hypothetical protein